MDCFYPPFGDANRSLASAGAGPNGRRQRLLDGRATDGHNGFSMLARISQLSAHPRSTVSASAETVLDRSFIISCSKSWHAVDKVCGEQEVQQRPCSAHSIRPDVPTAGTSGTAGAELPSLLFDKAYITMNGPRGGEYGGRVQAGWRSKQNGATKYKVHAASWRDVAGQPLQMQRQTTLSKPLSRSTRRWHAWLSAGVTPPPPLGPPAAAARPPRHRPPTGRRPWAAAAA